MITTGIFIDQFAEQKLIVQAAHKAAKIYAKEEGLSYAVAFSKALEKAWKVFYKVVEEESFLSDMKYLINNHHFNNAFPERNEQIKNTMIEADKLLNDYTFLLEDEKGIDENLELAEMETNIIEGNYDEEYLQKYIDYCNENNEDILLRTSTYFDLLYLEEEYYEQGITFNKSNYLANKVNGLIGGDWNK